MIFNPLPMWRMCRHVHLCGALTLRLAIVATYPPRPCGIGTFSQDLRSALVAVDPALGVDVVSIVRDHHVVSEPEVVEVIRQDVLADYVAVPAALDGRGTDVVLIEHEYGIFGGEAGSHVLALVRGLTQPFVVTLHTVLSEPTDRQAEVLGELCRRAALVTVFTDTARRMIVGSGLVPAERIRVIPHGVPSSLLPPQGDAIGDARAAGQDTAPSVTHVTGRTVLSTFGLISSGKGIETVIEALPAVAAQHPDVLYLVAGQTHPEVVKDEGERYRLSLERLVRDLHLERHVQFLDRFLSLPELAFLLASTDLYVTPYRSRQQIVSGALTFAVAAGCAVVSTPYLYAEDLLASGAGMLVPFDDPAAMATGVLRFLDDPSRLAAAAAEARRVGASLSWPAVAAHTVEVLRLAQQLGSPDTTPAGAGRVASSPPIRPDHLLTLVDDVGIVQHADGVVPNRASGYCVDDVARLVIVALGLDRDPDDRTFARTVALGVGFLRHAWDPAALGMHNFMSYDRRWLDNPHNGDHVGRAIWALGAVIAAQPPRAVSAPSLRLMTELGAAARRTDSLRTMAFAVIGLTRPPSGALPSELRDLLPQLAEQLLAAYRDSRGPDWPWFEDRLTYDNARLSQALIAAGHRLKKDAMLTAGLEGLGWYGTQCGLDRDHVRLIGNSWQRSSRSPRRPEIDGDEQPLDAAALVEALTEAMAATGQRAHGVAAVRAFEWFLGRNRLGEPVYDFTTGGCHDGLSASGLNDNEGAESTLAYFQALLALEMAGLQSSRPRQ